MVFSMLTSSLLALSASTLVAAAPAFSASYSNTNVQQPNGLPDPEIFQSYAHAPNTPIDGLSFEANEYGFVLGGHPAFRPCTPHLNRHCPKPAPHAAAQTVFKVYRNGSAKLDTLNPSTPQQLYVTENGQLSYNSANLTLSSIPTQSVQSPFSTAVIPPRGLNATINRTWRFTGGGASSFQACETGSGGEPDVQHYSVWADVEGFRGDLFEKPCVQFVAVAVAWKGANYVWEYE